MEQFLKDFLSSKTNLRRGACQNISPAKFFKPINSQKKKKKGKEFHFQNPAQKA